MPINNYRHGHSPDKNPSKTYKCWQDMKRRCNCPTSNRYQYYGARGISYDPKWEKFEGFLEDMGERPLGLQIDRMDNSQGYSKLNCRWATRSEQMLNRRPYTHKKKRVYNGTNTARP